MPGFFERLSTPISAGDSEADRAARQPSVARCAAIPDIDLQIEMVDAGFYRNRGAYLVGKYPALRDGSFDAADHCIAESRRAGFTAMQ